MTKYAKTILYLYLIIFCNNIFSNPNDSIKVKKGWTFGAVPAIAFDSDIGFKYGGVVNLFDYGNGSRYPKYNHSLYLEWSRTTKGSGINQIIYDSDRLIPKIRLTAEMSYLTEKALDFYGFNGYEANYHPEIEDESSSSYISRLYYRLDRKFLRLKSDFRGSIGIDNLFWLAGITYYNVKIDTIDVDNLNKGKSEADKLPYTNGGLYGNYVRWGLIKPSEIHGGNAKILKVGIVYDSREKESNPMQGIFSDIQILVAPSFLKSSEAFSRVAITHRQYFTIIKKRMSLAYRLSYQAKLSGTMPFYMLPFSFNQGPNIDRDGLGGSKTIRGVLRDRIVGEDYVYGNIEPRLTILKSIVFNQNFNIVFSPFIDGGMVTKQYQLPKTNNAVALAELGLGKKETPHFGIGAGLHFILNENFVTTLDYGIALDKRDGKSGMYINIGYLF
jgi:hypothetical protein